MRIHNNPLIPPPPLLLIAALTLPLQTASHARSGPEPLASMGEVTVSASQAWQLLGNLAPEQRKALTVENAETVVKQELLRARVLADARRDGLDRRQEVAALMQRAAEQALIDFQLALASSIPPDSPPEAELLKAYQDNKAGLVSTREFRVAQIFLSGQSAKVRDEANRIARDAQKKKADFAALAKAHSQHRESAAKGGELGWLAENNLLPEIRAALKGMAPGEAGKVVATQAGYHVLKLLERREGRPLTLDEARPALRQALRKKQVEGLRNAYLKQLQEKTPPVVNRPALEALVGQIKAR